ncbi:MAG: hypothetical protein ACRDTH_23120 [Pseudonocardiaceae bacterium]
MTERVQVDRRRKPEAQRKAREAVHHYLAGLSYSEIAARAGYSNPGNAWRAVQKFLDDTPDPANSTRQRTVENHRLDAIWRLAWPAAEQGDVASLRVLLEVSRRRSALNGLDKPAVLQLEGPGDTGQQRHVPTLRELLPVEEFAEVRSVREQALLLHRALPAGSSGETSVAVQVGADLADVTSRGDQGAHWAGRLQSRGQSAVAARR